MSRTICIITARGNSTRIPGKNKRLFHGRPIICYPIMAALESSVFDEVIVSSDDTDIRDIANRNGARFLQREPEFARNEVGTKAVMARCCEQLGLAGNDIVCCLYPTAPMIRPSDLQWMNDLLILKPAYFVVSIGTEPLADAGQAYFSLSDHWKDTKMPIYGMRTAYYPMPTNRVCDINLPEDWNRAEQMYAALKETA